MVDSSFLKQVNRRIAAWYAAMLVSSVGCTALLLAMAGLNAPLFTKILMGFGGWICLLALFRAVILRPVLRRTANDVQAQAGGSDIADIRSNAVDAELTFVVDLIDRYVTAAALAAPSVED